MSEPGGDETILPTPNPEGEKLSPSDTACEESAIVQQQPETSISPTAGSDCKSPTDDVSPTPEENSECSSEKLFEHLDKVETLRSKPSSPDQTAGPSTRADFKKPEASCSSIQSSQVISSDKYTSTESGEESSIGLGTSSTGISRSSSTVQALVREGRVVYRSSRSAQTSLIDARTDSPASEQACHEKVPPKYWVITLIVSMAVLLTSLVFVPCVDHYGLHTRMPGMICWSLPLAVFIVFFIITVFLWAGFSTQN